MKFLIDADSPYSLIAIFNKYGHKAVHVRVALGAATDEEIYDYAQKNDYVIVTRDLGFAETFLKNKGLGLILMRLPYYFTVDKINKVFDEFLNEINVKEMVNSIVVVELGRYRTKKL
ncbi:DUF5615 family PIN-like protein [Candidatus Woesearchaeota archaeon]|nr:DUF5615 family PIN-like protein [Candidatus Woesearchaeota archaeon]